jgi:hypothetical protein
MTVKYRSPAYVIYTNPDTVVVPGDHEERRLKFPEIHNLIELDRQRQFSAYTVTWPQLQQALQDNDNKKK